MNTRIPSTKHDALAKKYRAGASLADLAAIYGVSRQRIHQILIRLGVPRRSRGRPA